MAEISVVFRQKPLHRLHYKFHSMDGKDPEIKSWATGKLDALRHHHEMAKRMQESVKENKNQ